MHRTFRLQAFALAIILAAGACSGSTEDPAAPTTVVETSTSLTTTLAPPTTPTTASPSTTTNPDDEVLAAVRSFWDLFIEVGGIAGPFDAETTRARLAAQTTGDQLTTLFQFFQGNAAAGYVVRGEIDLAPVVVSNDGTTAQVRDCYDDRTGVYRASDGVRIDSDDGARSQVLMTLHNEDGVWKVAATIDEGAGCVVS